MTTGALKLLRNKTLYQQSSADYADIEYAAHLARAGAYISRNEFFVLDRKFNRVEPMVFASDKVSAVIASGGVNSESARGTLRGIDYGNALYMAASSNGTVWTSSDGLSWSSPGNSGVDAWDIAFGDGVWVVVGDDGTNGKIAYSNDDGATWTAATGVSSDLVRSIVYDKTTGFFVAAGGDLLNSTDDGATWTVRNSMSGVVNGAVYGLSVDQTRGIIIAPVPFYFGGVISGSPGEFWSTDGGMTWSGGAGWGIPTSYTQASASDDSGLFVGANVLNGDIYSSADGHSWSFQARLGIGLYDVLFDPKAAAWMVCGDNGAVYTSTDLATWTPYNAFGGTTTQTLWAMATDANGQIVVVGEGGTILITSANIGLPSGGYTIHVIAYIETGAGKLVFGYDQLDVTFDQDGGNTVAVQVSTVSKLIADTAPIWAVPIATAQEVMVDVYLKYTPDQTADTSQTTTSFTDLATPSVIRYAFTASLPATGVNELAQIGDVIKDLPLGEPLGDNKGMTTIVFENSQTALHLGRIFGMVSQTESRWESEDGTSLEIANKGADFVLGYTEDSWANFMRPDNYLVLRPTQSSELTGLASTPSGLMVMFDSEIFVISGDPDVGGLNVQAYPDVVGNDVGTTPTKLGGVPIVIWDGQIYALSGGKAQPLSQPVYRADDPFVRVVAEPQSRCLIAVAASGRTFRYFFEYQFWMDDPAGTATIELLPNIAGGDTGDYTRAIDGSGNAYATKVDGSPDTPFLQWDDVDWGVGILKGPEMGLVAGRRSSLYRARFLIPGLSFVTDRTAGGYDASLVPRMYYRVTSAQAAVDDPASTDYVLGLLSEERLAFRLPLGLKSRLSDLRLELRSMGYDAILRPPMTWFYAMSDKVG